MGPDRRRSSFRFSASPALARLPTPSESLWRSSRRYGRSCRSRICASPASSTSRASRSSTCGKRRAIVFAAGCDTSRAVETEENDTQRRIASLRASLASGEHLNFDDEMVPYVDGRLDADAKRAVESHLANCEVCRREIDDLRKFAAAPRRVRRPAVIAALTAAAAAIAIGVTVLMQGP